jgi:hypothetical protein
MHITHFVLLYLGGFTFVAKRTQKHAFGTAIRMSGSRSWVILQNRLRKSTKKREKKPGPGLDVRNRGLQSVLFKKEEVLLFLLLLDLCEVIFLEKAQNLAFLGESSFFRSGEYQLTVYGYLDIFSANSCQFRLDASGFLYLSSQTGRFLWIASTSTVFYAGVLYLDVVGCDH